MAKLSGAAEIEVARPSTDSAQIPFPRWSKALISALLVLHVAAVVSAPLAFVCRSRGGESPATEAIARFFRPYSDAFYLNHGYAFFAPDPGPNHLVDFKVEFDDGRAPVTGRFPDLATERPRLLYHRYFMLSEALNNRFAPPEFAPEPSPPPLTASAGERERFAVAKQRYEQEKSRWQHARRQYEAMRTSIDEHLQHSYGGNRVTLTRIEHLPADPEDVLYERKSLSATESYREMPETMPTGGRR
jgi:hypothetical protein